MGSDLRQTVTSAGQGDRAAIDWFVVGAVALQRANLGDQAAFPRALECLDQAIDLSPTAQAVFHFRRTEAAAMAGAVGQLCLGVRALETLWSDSAPALTLAGHVLTGHDQRRALELLERATTMDPELATAWLYLGFARRYDQDFVAVIAACERAIALPPGLAAAHGELAAARFFIDDVNGALESILEALRLDDLDPDLHRRYVDLLMAIGDSGRVAAERSRFEGR